MFFCCSSLPILKRCIPVPTSKLKKGVTFENFYEYLNSLNIFKQILGDLAVTWVSVLVLTSFSFGKDLTYQFII